jgi:hypothetical protein
LAGKSRGRGNHSKVSNEQIISNIPHSPSRIEFTTNEVKGSNVFETPNPKGQGYLVNLTEEPECLVESNESLAFWRTKFLGMGEEVEAPKKKEPVTFEYPIQDSYGMNQMKNIPPSSFPNSRGMANEDLDTFLFEFVVLCWSDDYSTDAHKLKLLLANLKEETLCWFMGLGGTLLENGMK